MQERSLDANERKWVLEVLKGQRIHAMGISRLYLCKEGYSEWRYTGLLGVAALCAEETASSKSHVHFIRLIDLQTKRKKKAVIFEQEIYESMVYHKLTPFFHAFEVDGFVAALSFTFDVEALYYFNRVQRCLTSLREKRPDTPDRLGIVWTPPSPRRKTTQPLSKKKEEKTIDLIAHPQPLIPEDVVRFGTGSEAIADGISVKWKRNSA